MNQPIVRDVALSDGSVDLHDWRAWSVSSDGSMVATAAAFGAPGGVAIDVATGAIERQGDARLVDADRPLWWLPGERGFRDPGAQVTFAVPDDDASTAALRNDGAGRLARLARGPSGLRLQMWNASAAMAWSAAIEPVPDTAGIALRGDTVVLAQATGDGAIGVRAYAVADGAVRWSATSALVALASSPVWQPVGFTDDGAVWIAGAPAGGVTPTIEQRGAGDGAAGPRFTVDKLPANGGGFGAVSTGGGRSGFWVASVAYNPGGDRRGPSRWFASYALYAGGGPPAVDSEVRDADLRAVFDEARGDDSRARALRPAAGGGMVLVSVRGRGLRVTRWATPPGAR
jgi:hypothetical protein